jgi:hypothetical protein
VSFGGASSLDNAAKRMAELLQNFCSAKNVEYKIVN